MDLNQSLKDYLAAYADKDLTAVSDMFAQNIKLRDWKISVSNKALAIAETEKNFNADGLIQSIRAYLGREDWSQK